MIFFCFALWCAQFVAADEGKKALDKLDEVKKAAEKLAPSVTCKLDDVNVGKSDASRAEPKKDENTGTLQVVVSGLSQYSKWEKKHQGGAVRIRICSNEQ